MIVLQLREHYLPLDEQEWGVQDYQVPNDPLDFHGNRDLIFAQILQPNAKDLKLLKLNKWQFLIVNCWSE